jgi:hypothetical protein
VGRFLYCSLDRKLTDGVIYQVSLLRVGGRLNLPLDGPRFKAETQSQDSSMVVVEPGVIFFDDTMQSFTITVKAKQTLSYCALEQGSMVHSS